MELFDKDGNPVENVFTEADLMAKIEEAKKSWEESIKPPEPVKAEEQPAVEPKPVDEMPAWAKELKDKIERLSSNETTRTIQNLVSDLDADTQKVVMSKYDTLAGYDDTPEGIQRRAEDAYLLATGERYQGSTTNMQNLAAPHTAKANVTNNTGKKFDGPQDKEIQRALGITEQDIEKYGNK